jgi:hypothetical protein
MQFRINWNVFHPIQECLANLVSSILKNGKCKITLDLKKESQDRENQCWQPNRNRNRNLGFFGQPNLTSTRNFAKTQPKKTGFLRFF